MKIKNILLGSVLSLSLLSFASCNKSSKHEHNHSSETQASSMDDCCMPTKEESMSMDHDCCESSSDATSSTIESSEENSSIESSESYEPMIIGQRIVSKDEFAEDVKDIDNRPEELGYVVAILDYDYTNGDDSREGYYTYYYDSDVNKWSSEDEGADEFILILNYNITSRMGNPNSELTFLEDPFAIKEEGSDSNAYFEWNNEGLLVEFSCEGWYNYGDSTFKLSYSNGIK